jgi:hypothetical protein
MATNLTTGQASIGASAASLVAARTNRRSVVVRNTHASQVLFLGKDSAVTTANGLAVPAGQATELTYDGQVFAIASGASTTVLFAELHE